MLESAEIEREPSRPFPPRVRLKVVYSGKWLNIPVNLFLFIIVNLSYLLKLNWLLGGGSCLNDTPNSL